MEYLDSDINLHLSALFFLAFEDRGSITKQVLDALQGCLVARPRAVSIDVSGVRAMVSG